MMAYFLKEQLENEVTAAKAWRQITEAIKAGNQSVEIVQRRVDGKEVWELRAWDDIRGTTAGSNAKNASGDIDY